MIIQPALDILAFIDAQPDLIKPRLHMAVALPYEPSLMRALDVADLAALTSLSVMPEFVAFYRCIGAVAALDFLFNDPKLLVTARTLMSQLPFKLIETDPTLARMALQGPLEEKQLERAREAWVSIRQASLSDEALRAHLAMNSDAWTQSLLGI